VHGCAASYDLGQRPVGVRGQIRERTERSGSEEALAPTRPHPDAIGVTDPLDDRALPDARFSGDHDQATAPGDGLHHRGPQAGQRILPFQQRRSEHWLHADALSSRKATH
jgi:hypothetical protein